MSLQYPHKIAEKDGHLREIAKKDCSLPYLVILCQHTHTAAKRCLAAALLLPPPQPPRCCHSAATVALCAAAIAADAAATAALLPSCRQHPAVVLPPPPCRHQAAANVVLLRCRHRRSCRAAATTLPPLRCAPPPRCCRRPRAVALPPWLLPSRRCSLVGCRVVIRRPILSSHAVMSCDHQRSLIAGQFHQSQFVRSKHKRFELCEGTYICFFF